MSHGHAYRLCAGHYHTSVQGVQKVLTVIFRTPKSVMSKTWKSGIVYGAKVMSHICVSVRRSITSLSIWLEPWKYRVNEIILIEFCTFWEGFQHEKSPWCKENGKRRLLSGNIPPDSWHDAFSGVSKHRIRIKRILELRVITSCNSFKIMFCIHPRQRQSLPWPIDPQLFLTMRKQMRDSASAEFF
jgi:hypothetical protein